MFNDLLEKANSKWTRLVILLVVGVNTGAMIFDTQLIPYTDEQIAGGISIVAMVIVELWNHWKNNSYTKPSKEADTYMKSRKNKLKK